MTKKMKFRQVPTEYQESPLFYDFYGWKNLFIESGNIDNYDIDDDVKTIISESDYIRINDLVNELNEKTNIQWAYKEIHGCCQGDWERCIYDSSLYTDKQIELFEIEYFNLGSEYIDDDNTSYYCHYDPVYELDDVKKELSDFTGHDPEEIEIDRFTGFERIAKYETV